MLINHTSKQVTAKIVYYGTGLGGKTTNLQYIYSVTNPRTRGELICMETEIERTLFFDLLPINVGLIKGYETKFQLYTVPGQVFYDSTRKLVLKGADGIVFVADSQELMEQANCESLENLKENLAFYSHRVEDLPMVFQYNKRDLKSVSSVDALNGRLNGLKRPYFEAVARTGRGVIETLREISSLTLVRIKEALEHATRVPKNVAVHFDVNHGQQVFKIEDLPIKKVSVEQLAATEAAQEILAKPEAPAPAAGIPAPKPTPRSFSELLGRLEDPTRITKIEKIAAGNGRLTVEIKDGDGRPLRRLDISLLPETKKVNIILDVKS
ncbi:MAG: GTPase domain-containing protein [Candidatus Aminicenantes bacterium]|nr:GTPase domain-containing protein [Candidatus Aminicenantes bacterium]